MRFNPNLMPGLDVFNATYYLYLIIAVLVVFLVLAVHIILKNTVGSALTAFIGMLGYVIHSALGPQWQVTGPTAIKIDIPPFIFLIANNATITPSPHVADYRIFPILLTVLIICCIFKLPK